MSTKTDWKHGQHFTTEAEPDAIVVFDDDDPECDSLYYRFGESLSPIRTVYRASAQHWRNTLLSWAAQAPLEDRRNNQFIPLP